jgi:hypothetical protein
MIVEFGGTDALCDIGPTPLGDGVVDFEDLKVLAGYIGREVDDPTLIAHWPFDEAEGAVAHDSVGRNGASVTGGATWHPEGGQVGGALELDGIDGHVVTELSVNPGAGPCSVCLWVRGGVPGQVIVAQADGTKPGPVWLSTDRSDGKLMTNVMFPLPPLMSDSVITDGQWHRVALVWDGTRRHLHVDGVVVAADMLDLPAVIPSDGILHLGTDKAFTPGAFWAGLIDDVRIYNRVVKP